MSRQIIGFDAEMQKALEADGEKLAQLTGEDHGPVFIAEEPVFSPLNASDFEVERDGVILHIMISDWRPDLAHVILRGPGGVGPDIGSFAPYDRMEPAQCFAQMKADGWALKTVKQMIVTERYSGYATVVVSGVCSPDVTVEDVEKRFYHSYFGGREAWVKDGRFGCTIHTD